jgi:hypothetical protein
MFAIVLTERWIIAIVLVLLWVVLPLAILGWCIKHAPMEPEDQTWG